MNAKIDALIDVVKYILNAMSGNAMTSQMRSILLERLEEIKRDQA